MEGLQKAVRSAISLSSENNISTSISSTFDKAKASLNSAAASASSGSTPTDSPPLLLTRPPGRWCQSGLAQSFVPFSLLLEFLLATPLKRRVRRWASKLLRRLKDD